MEGKMEGERGDRLEKMIEEMEKRVREWEDRVERMERIEESQ